MPSQRHAIPQTVERILAASASARLSAPQREDLAVALSEALSNAAIHGNGLRPRSSVSVRIDVEAGRGVTITIRDSGPGFDHEALPDPSEHVHLLLPRGRGVFLMRKLVDDVAYNRKGNEVRLTMLRRRRAAAAS
jgi:serine/threonine-protein kinase RsbW